MTCACHADDLIPTPTRTFDRRRMLATGLAAGLVPLLPRWSGVAGAQETEATGAAEGSEGGPVTRDFGFLPPRPATEVHRRPIMFPVLPDAALGRATWTDTYLAPRSNGRRHEGQDLMGRKMLKLLACTDGVIVELRHQAAGNSLYLQGDDGYFYCYLHINNDRPGTDDASNILANAFAPGMAVGTRVAMGDHIAYLGDSGNAEATGAHCHFEIRLPNARWYNAAACNAKYSLESARPAQLRGAVSAADFAPFTDSGAFARQQAEDFLGQVPSDAWLFTAASNLNAGTITPDRFIEDQLASTQVKGLVNPVLRLYLAYFGGIPAYAGVAHWNQRCRSGVSLDQASVEMAASPKFRTQWGALSNRAFARRIRLNLTGTEPTAGALDLLTAQLDQGTSRGAFVRMQCEDPGYRTSVANKIRVLSVYHAMARKSPDSYWWKTWAERDRTSAAGMGTLIRTFRTSAAYRALHGS
jgi:murein DD-endopeptidase MepM/ murein hydrolase activator NlpD